ncbi:Hypothetical predicted protein [Pelobates cultripes]|uniref:Uncharacterized protein n=1 Tax=Pelobates cultripes TaxID=61616 RepID=A0AAD1WHC2_PELCU|nr:Hypothetical predicted protein [Pelobates cultripes]
MLQDRKASLRADFRQMVTILRKDTQELCTAHNDVVDKLQRLEEEQSAMQQNMADMEDRLWRNNICFCKIADAITAESLPQYLKALYKTLVPHLDDTSWTWTFDRVHHLSRPVYCYLVIRVYVLSHH